MTERETRDPRHILVEDNEVEGALGSHGQRVGTAAGGHHLVALGVEKHYVGLEKINLFVGPKYSHSSCNRGD